MTQGRWRDSIDPDIALSPSAEAVLAAIETLPLHRWYGLQLERLSRVDAVIHLPLRADILHRDGRFNGAILNHLLDVPTLVCLLPHLAAGTTATTVSIAVEHLDGAPLDSQGIALEARPVRVGRRIVITESAARAGGQILARMHATKLVIATQ